VDGFAEWKDIVTHYIETPLTECTPIYDFFFMLDKAMQRYEKEKQAFDKMRAKQLHKK
jgi:hypothetical protein